MAQKALTGSRIDFDDTNGFFRPFYWLGLIVEYLIGGLNPFWFYFTNLVVFWFIVAEIIALIRLKGGSIIQSSLGAIIFALSSPIVESFYTNSKPEAQQLMWLAGSLLSGHFLAHPKKEKRIVATVATTLFILFASLNKSTFIALIPISLGWVVLYWLFLKKDQDEKRRAVGYFISSLMATAAYFILRKWAMPIGILQGTYTNDYILNINFMIFMLNHWIVRLSSGYLGFLFSLVLLLAFWKKVELATRKMALASLLWMIGWFVIYLPWGHALDYYLLPFAFGYAVFCGTILGSLSGFLEELKTPAKTKAIALSSIFGLFVLMGMATNSSNARIQLIMDRQDLRLLEFLSENAQPGEEIAVNLGKNATFYAHVQILMTIIGNRDDLKFTPFQFQDSPSESNKPYLLIMPVIKDPPLVKVRGYGEGQTPLNKSLDAFIFGLQPIFVTGEKSHLLSFNPAILACPFTHKLPFYSIYCSKSASLLVDSRDYSFGWRVYKIDTNARRLPIPLVYTAEGDLTLFDQDDWAAEYSFPAGDLPISADWNADGFTDIVLFNPDELNWRVHLYPFDQKVSTFVVPGMTAGDVPLAGDWNCDGSATPGYFRPSDVSWHFWNNLNESQEFIRLTGARPNDVPISGDWDGDGCDTVGVYRPDKGEVNLENKLIADLSGIDFNAPVDMIPIPADWGGLGMETLAFYKDGLWQISFANCECPPANGLKQLEFGAPGDIPLAGRWK